MGELRHAEKHVAADAGKTVEIEEFHLFAVVTNFNISSSEMGGKVE
ncbi:MAG: hypothetical protein PCFJNLEI_01027 [Verrucomicrobiae bacterium]|nr:hypothetical protein [Verrucomicrobiae bacterium]